MNPDLPSAQATEMITAINNSPEELRQVTQQHTLDTLIGLIEEIQLKASDEFTTHREAFKTLTKERLDSLRSNLDVNAPNPNIDAQLSSLTQNLDALIDMFPELSEDISQDPEIISNLTEQIVQSATLKDATKLQAIIDELDSASLHNCVRTLYELPPDNWESIKEPIAKTCYKRALELQKESKGDAAVEARITAIKSYIPEIADQEPGMFDIAGDKAMEMVQKFLINPAKKVPGAMGAFGVMIASMFNTPEKRQKMKNKLTSILLGLTGGSLLKDVPFIGTLTKGLEIKQQALTAVNSMEVAISSQPTPPEIRFDYKPNAAVLQKIISREEAKRMRSQKGKKSVVTLQPADIEAIVLSKTYDFLEQQNKIREEKNTEDDVAIVISMGMLDSVADTDTYDDQAPDADDAEYTSLDELANASILDTELKFSFANEKYNLSTKNTGELLLNEHEWKLQGKDAWNGKDITVTKAEWDQDNGIFIQLGSPEAKDVSFPKLTLNTLFTTLSNSTEVTIPLQSNLELVRVT